jgi:hypothetical protein
MKTFLSNQISKIHIEKTHTKFCKFVLGIRAMSSDLMMQSEESWETIQYFTIFY